MHSDDIQGFVGDKVMKNIPWFLCMGCMQDAEPKPGPQVIPPCPICRRPMVQQHITADDADTLRNWPKAWKELTEDIQANLERLEKEMRES